MKIWYVRGICTLVGSTLLIASSSVLAAPLRANGFVKQAVVISPLPPQNTHKSYREWKTFMIEAANSRVTQTQKNLENQRNISTTSADPNLKRSKQTQGGLNPKLIALQNQLEKEQLQMAMASELTITDYFVGYITQQKNMSDTIKDVSGKLTSDEVAELMAAYADNFFKSSYSAPKTVSGSNANSTEN